MTGSESARKDRPDREAEERRLVQAAQRDPARFGEVYEAYFELVYAYVARRVRNRSEAEDLTADVFRKALQSLPRFKWTGAPFAAWLFRIASNMIADRAKRAAREGNVEASLAIGKGNADQSGSQLSNPATQEEHLEQTERSAELFRLVNDLADDQRRILLMRFAEERTIHEIAQTLGRSEGAIKQLQFRALENVRKRLASSGE
jgi:RNA polymerase sigma-70 factor (ECF subfamily)